MRAKIKIHIVLVIAILLLSFILVSCQIDTQTEENYLSLENPSLQQGDTIISVIDFNLAAQSFAVLDALWDTDNGALWGMTLHMPMIIACEITRDAVSSHPFGTVFMPQLVDDLVIYAGTLPDHLFVSNTAVTMHGYRWGMVTWRSMKELADDETERLRLLSHEGFHALQPQLFGGFYSTMSTSSSRDTEGAQISYILEIAALVAAWNTTENERLESINDALYIRNARRQAYNTSVDENLLEVLEGLAMYTEIMLTLSYSEIKAEVNAWTEVLLGLEFRVEIAWGYFSGALYGLLLDEFNTDWRTDAIDAHTDLGRLLQEAAEISELAPPIDLERYGYANIVIITQSRIIEHERQVQAALDALTQPQIRLPVLPNYGQEIDDIIVLSSDNSDWIEFVIRAGVLTCHWGRLEVEDGYLLNVSRRGHFILSAPSFETVGNRIYGDGWVLELDDLWELYPEGDGFVTRQRE